MSHLRLPVILLFQFCTITGYSQEISVRLDRKEQGLDITAGLEGVNFDKVITSLEDGLESEIFFEFRLYEKSQGFFSFLGDKLIIDKTPHYTARINYLDKTYNIFTEEGKILTFEQKENFINQFSKIESYRLTDFPFEENRSYYIRARIRLNHVKLVPPLNIISLFHRISVTTKWKQVEIK